MLRAWAAPLQDGGSRRGRSRAYSGRASTSAQTWSMTSSRDRWVVSTTTASSACASGEVARLGVLGVPLAQGGLGLVRRRRPPCRGRRPARPAARRVRPGSAVTKTFRSASGRTTVVMSRPSTTMPPPAAVAAATSSRWIATSRSRTAGHRAHRADGAGDGVAADGAGDVGPAHVDRRRRRVGAADDRRRRPRRPRRRRRRRRRSRHRARPTSSPGTWRRCPGSAGPGVRRPRGRRWTCRSRPGRRRR